jgi:hypothetical protein
MTKAEIKEVVDDLRKHKTYPGVDTTPIHGLGLSDFPKGKYIRREVISNFLNWQCMLFNGNIDEEELDNCLFLLKDKRVMMV